MKPYLSARSLVMLKEFLAELLGTCVLLMFGCGCVAQSVLSGGDNGGMLSINIGWGLGVLAGVLIAGPVSGMTIDYGTVHNIHSFIRFILLLVMENILNIKH